MDPDGDPCQFYGDVVDVEPVDAATRYLAPQQRGWFDLEVGCRIAQIGFSGCFKASELVRDAGQLVVDEEGGHARFDAVDGRD